MSKDTGLLVVQLRFAKIGDEFDAVTDRQICKSIGAPRHAIV